MGRCRPVLTPVCDEPAAAARGVTRLPRDTAQQARSALRCDDGFRLARRV